MCASLAVLDDRPEGYEQEREEGALYGKKGKGRKKMKMKRRGEGKEMDEREGKMKHVSGPNVRLSN